MFCQACARASTLPTLRSSRLRIKSVVQNSRLYASSTAIQITDPIVLYENLVRSGRIQQDEQQLRLLYQLRKIHDELMDYKPSYSLRYLLESARTETGSSSSPNGDDRGAAGAITQTIIPSKATKALVQALTHEDDLSNLDSPEGFLLTGSVGTGKTMLLDLFYDSLPIKKKRIHYHAFLLGLYRQVFVALEEQRLAADNEEREMQSLAGLNGRGYPWSRKEENKAKALTRGWRQVFAGGRSYDDPTLIKEYVLAKIALDLINEATVLAFDEVQLVDIAGAGILRRVLTWYWRLGGVVIGTSNRLPSDLYQQGVQREQFQAFLGHLQARCPVYELRSKEDWRRRRRTAAIDMLSSESTGLPAWTQAFNGEMSWFTDKKGFEDLFNTVTTETEGSPKQLTVYGRPLHVPLQVEGQVARFRFADLCEQALGPADYLSITSHYPTIVISDIPQLKLTAKNEARRFITFLDAAYESRTRLICLAASVPDDIFFPDAAKALSAAAAAEANGEDNPLAQDMIGEVMQDLEAPFRPNISSYTATAVKENLEQAMKDAQTTAPAFRNLSIFTGQDEQFAYKRALSRIYELTSKEFIQSAVHNPIPAEARVWEHNAPVLTSSAAARVPTSQATTVPSTSSDSVTSQSSKEERASEGSTTLPRGTKIDPLNPQVDISELPKPKIASTHIWGIVDTWGKKAGKWGQGVEAKKMERQARLDLMRDEDEKEKNARVEEKRGV